MSKNELNYEKLIVWIEDAIKKGINISIVCNGRLAEWLVEYVGIEYPEFRENCQFNKNIDEYYITFQTFDGELIITCEFARTKKGLLKRQDIQDCIYFVFTDNWREVQHAMNSNMIALCELVEDEDIEIVFDCDGDDDCDEYSDDEWECDDDCDGEWGYDCEECEQFCNCDDCLVEEYAKSIIESCGCLNCIQALLKIFAEEIRDNNN